MQTVTLQLGKKNRRLHFSKLFSLNRALKDKGKFSKCDSQITEATGRIVCFLGFSNYSRNSLLTDTLYQVFF